MTGETTRVCSFQMQDVIQEQGADTRHRWYESLLIHGYTPLNERPCIDSHDSQTASISI